MAQNPIFSPIIRPLAALTAAVGNARNALYTPPRASIQGIDETLWPNPLQPVQPMGPPKAEPLTWPFEWGRNLIFTPRDDAEYSATDLRRLGTYPLARVCIENSKDMVAGMPHKIQLKPLEGETSKDRAARSKGDNTLKLLNKFFDNPNPEQDWSAFLRPLLEDMLVIDAASIFVGRTAKGKVSELRWIEGAGITRLVDEHGWTPQAPNPAYQQNWQGYPRVDLTVLQLIYRPRNIVPRGTQSSFMYGMSPTEQMAPEIRIGMERLKFVFDFYASGSIPGGMHFVPPNTPPEKIREAQQYLDATYAGNLPRRRQLQLIQGWQVDGHPEQLAFPKEPELADMFDEIHTRKICFAYGTSPQRLMRQMNRASAASAQSAAEEEGTIPWMRWLKSVVDHIIQNILGYPEYEFAFDPFHELDIKKQADADAVDIKNGLYTINEKREARGDDPRPEAAADQLLTMTTQGAIPLGETIKPPGIGKAEKAERPNGHTTFATCSKHSGQYPRSFCEDCIKAEQKMQRPAPLPAIPLQRGMLDTTRFRI